MPKIITARRAEGEVEKAREYVKVHILMPAGLLGLIAMLAGVFALIYQFVVETYDWRTFVVSTGLIMAGGLLGWVQTRYHQYVLREYPRLFASRLAVPRMGHKPKKESQAKTVEHPGQSLVPWLYVLGIGTLLAASVAAWRMGPLDSIAAFFLPWAGFFWAKLFFWRRVLGPAKKP
jgi:hypothetical protein